MDILVFDFLYSFAHRSPMLDGVIVFFASFFPFAAGGIFFFLVFVLYSGWKERLFLFLGLVLSGIFARGLFTEAVRFFTERPRPFSTLEVEPLFHPSGFSFPSGHAALFFAFSFFFFFISRKWGGFALLLALGIGLFRVVAGVHFPSDILGGLVFGFCAALLVWYVLPSEAVLGRTRRIDDAF